MAPSSSLNNFLCIHGPSNSTEGHVAGPGFSIGGSNDVPCSQIFADESCSSADFFSS